MSTQAFSEKQEAAAEAVQQFRNELRQWTVDMLTLDNNLEKVFGKITAAGGRQEDYYDNTIEIADSINAILDRTQKLTEGLESTAERTAESLDAVRMHNDVDQPETNVAT